MGSGMSCSWGSMMRRSAKCWMNSILCSDIRDIFNLLYGNGQRKIMLIKRLKSTDFRQMVKMPSKSTIYRSVSIKIRKTI